MYPPFVELSLFHAVTLTVSPSTASDTKPSDGSTDEAISSPSKISSTLYDGALSPYHVITSDSQDPSPSVSDFAVAFTTT
mgnify:CR=1 FL=1